MSASLLQLNIAAGNAPFDPNSRDLRRQLGRLLLERAAHNGRLQVAAFGLLLAGCTTPAPEVRTFRVEVPVAIPCRAPDVSVPAWAASGLKKSDSLEVKVRALLAERRQRIGYERELVAAADACR